MLFPGFSALFMYCMGINIPDGSVYQTIYLIVFFSALMLSLVVFFVYLVMFFIKVKTVIFSIEPDECEIEFWKSKKDAQRIDEFIDQIKQKQKTIEMLFERPTVHNIDTSRFSPLLKSIFPIFLSALPALILENRYLFFLLFLPVIWFVYKGILYIRQPLKYRKAGILCVQKQWDKAINLLSKSAPSTYLHIHC